MTQTKPLPRGIVWLLRGLWFVVAHLPLGVIRWGSRLLFKSGHKRFLHALKDPRQSQINRLMDILHDNRDTDFGRRHAFLSIDSVEAYQRQVPIRGYPDFESDIHRMLQGESSVLVNAPVTFFARSSGTTGAAKYIPVTEAYLNEMRAVRGLWSRAITQIFPGLVRGHFLTMHSPGIEGYSPMGVPFGSITVAMGGAREDKVDALLQGIPHGIFTVQDFDSKYYLVLRAALDRNISLAGALNPSTLLILFQRLGQWHAQLAQDLEQGEVNPPKPVDAKIMALMTSSQQPRPHVAKLLRQSFARHGLVKPAEVWPKLTGLMCWKGGSAPFYLQKLRAYVDDMPIMDYGYAASEGAFTVVEDTGDGRGLVGVHGHFLEFIPEAQYGRPNPQALLVDQLQQGQRYAVIITAANGLYRYDIGDIVEVADMYNGHPRLRFMHKTGATLSLTGEKVSEAHVVTAVGEAQERSGLSLHGFLVSAQLADPSYYIVVGEHDPVSPQQLKDFLQAFDHALQRHNIEYAAKRDSQRLGPPRLRSAPSGRFEGLRSQRVADGAPDAHVKVPHLWRDISIVDKIAEGGEITLETP